MKEFREFAKISRLSRECIITEKIDGTNGVIYIGEDGEFLIGSRTRPEDVGFKICGIDLAHQQILALLPKKKEEYTDDFKQGNSYKYTKDGKRYYEISDNIAFNEAISEITHRLEGV